MAHNPGSQNQYSQPRGLGYDYFGFELTPDQYRRVQALKLPDSARQVAREGLASYRTLEEKHHHLDEFLVRLQGPSQHQQQPQALLQPKPPTLTSNYLGPQQPLPRAQGQLHLGSQGHPSGSERPIISPYANKPYAAYPVQQGQHAAQRPPIFSPYAGVPYEQAQSNQGQSAAQQAPQSPFEQVSGRSYGPNTAQRQPQTPQQPFNPPVSNAADLVREEWRHLPNCVAHLKEYSDYTVWASAEALCGKPLHIPGISANNAAEGMVNMMRGHRDHCKDCADCAERERVRRVNLIPQYRPPQ